MGGCISTETRSNKGHDRGRASGQVPAPAPTPQAGAAGTTPAQAANAGRVQDAYVHAEGEARRQRHGAQPASAAQPEPPTLRRATLAR